MLRSFVSLVLIALSVYGAPSKRQLAVTTFEGEKVASSYIVKLKDNASVDAHTSRLFANFRGSKVTHDLPLINAYAGTFTEAELEEILTSEDVESVEENGLFYLSTAQTDAPWGLQSISSRDPISSTNHSRLDYTYSYDSPAGEGADIYIIDSGIFVEHEQFEGRARWGWVAPAYEQADGHGHGTHCAGTAAGKTYGVSKNANLIAVKVMSDFGDGETADVIAGIQFVVDSVAASGRPSVASMSLGGWASTALDAAVKAGIAAGIPFTVAAGNNDYEAAAFSPARVPEAITVGSIAINNRKSGFSNYGSVIDIWAPGSQIISSWIGSPNETLKISGTSMATPHVAGLVAYLLGKEPTLSPAAVLDKIISLSTKDAIIGLPSGTHNRLAFNGVASA